MRTLALKVVPLASQEGDVRPEIVKLLPDGFKRIVEARLTMSRWWWTLRGRAGGLEMFVLDNERYKKNKTSVVRQ